ncbi:MAG: dihydroorotase [Aerococcaceae bacterium]|nr:dihydroorotase [Aerococcaceae bacterium]
MLIKNGNFFKNGQWTTQDIRIENQRITQIEDGLEPQPDETVYDVAGNYVTAGFIDVHVHWREPGFSYKETIAQASRAAARGGFTTAMPMPNLNPMPDTLEHLQQQLDIIARDSVIRAIPYAAITQGEKGAVLSDMEVLAPHVFAFSDDGRGVQDANCMYQAMVLAKQYNKPIVAHCEENSLIWGGCMHDGVRSQQLGLKGIPSVCESVQIARDILLAEATGCHYHVCHVSTKESVRVIRDAKRAGIHVTCEVCPHHLISDENDIPHDNGLWKMNPPLRATEDRQALIEGLLDGTIDIIATDHAPHAPHEKECGMADAAFGIVGSEAAFALLYTELVKKEVLTLEQLLALMNEKVATTFDLPYGRLEVGAVADVTVLDLGHSWTIDPENFLSKGRNTPYAGKEVYGASVLTISNGKVVYQA